MAFTIRKIEVWAGDIRNRPGMLARVLEAMEATKAELEFCVARRVTENTSRVFFAPLKTAAQKTAARDVGLLPATGMNTIRIEGPNRSGLGATMARAIATAGINGRGLTAAAIGRKSVTYIAFKTPDERDLAMKVLKKALSAPRKR